MSVGNPGYGIVFISTFLSLFGASKIIVSFFISKIHPVSSNL